MTSPRDETAITLDCLIRFAARLEVIGHHHDLDALMDGVMDAWSEAQSAGDDDLARFFDAARALVNITQRCRS